MKRHLMSASAIMLMVLAVSCAKNEIIPDDSDGGKVDPSQIAFRTTTTRANNNTIVEVKGGFNVIALNKSGAYVTGFADPSGDNVRYFYNTALPDQKWDWKENAEGKKWPTDPLLYPLTFFAAYPAVDFVKKDAVAVGIEVVSNMTPNASFKYNTQYGGSLNVVDPTKLTVDNLGASTEVTTTPISGFTELTFKHIMSNIQFKIDVPFNHEAIIQSIKIANVNKSGRQYNYKIAKWSVESYSDATHAHFAYFAADGASHPVQTITSLGEVNGFSDGGAGYNTLKLMPQTTVGRWALGTDDTTPASFKKDAKAWKAAHVTIDQTAINDWHNNNIGGSNPGMKNSDGWKGARIELTYLLTGPVNGVLKNLIGRKAGVDGALKDQFVRVGYMLDLTTLVATTGATEKGFLPGYKYIFTIPLGTTGATNGVLLDPDFKDAIGGGTDQPVDNPTNVVPGDPVTEAGVINFTVSVDDWTDSSQSIQ